ncbi:MAG: insulinase family protein [Myxococcota bacterium]
MILGWAMAAFAADVPAPAAVTAPGADPAATTDVAAPLGPDRTGPPTVAAPEVLTLPEPEVHPISPGVTALYVRAPGARKVAVQVVVRRGLVELEQNPTQLGRAIGAMADAAAGDLTGAELSSQRDLIEAELWSSIRLHEGEVSLLIPADDLGKGLDLQRLIVEAPSFPKKDLKRYVTDQRLFYTVNGPASQANVAASALAFAWFPPDHPYGVRPNLAELDQVKTKALVSRWRGWLTSSPITVLVVGDIDWSTIEPQVRALTAGLGAEAPVGRALPVTAPSATKVVGVDMPGQAQVAVRIRFAAPPRDDADNAAMTATNFLLGGHFLSRLNRNLREDKGFTYGAGSSYNYGETWGSVTVQVDVKREDVAATVTEIRKELGRLCTEPVPPEELDAMRRSLDADWNNTFTTADVAAGLYRRALAADWTIAHVKERLVAIDGVTPAGEDRPGVWVFVGDRKAVEPALGTVGLEAGWTDPAAAILGKF